MIFGGEMPWASNCVGLRRIATDHLRQQNRFSVLRSQFHAGEDGARRPSAVAALDVHALDVHLSDQRLMVRRADGETGTEGMLTVLTGIIVSVAKKTLPDRVHTLHLTHHTLLSTCRSNG